MRIKRNPSRRASSLAASVGLGLFLGACQVPATSAVDSSDAILEGDRAQATSVSVSDRDKVSDGSDERAAQDDPAIAAACPVGSKTSDANATEGTELRPLASPAEKPAFEQFNFQPQAILTADDTVVVKTPYYVFARCDGTAEWTITTAETVPEPPFDYEQQLANLADPDYQTLTVNGQDYQYRIRLEAEWLREQLAPPTTPAEELVPSSTDGSASPQSNSVDTVIFELKAPEKELISRKLYTQEDLQEAHLGASLGEPSIAGTVVTGTSGEEEIWFAATTSQGEGDSGFASLLNYDTQTRELTVQQPKKLQGDQITSIAATGSSDSEADTPLTLWLGTQRSGEGNPYFPASGLVAYQPATEALTAKTVTNSPLVGAIPHQLAVSDETLWVGTGNGVCEVDWQQINKPESWECWRFTATATLSADGVNIYKSLLSTEPAGKLTGDTAEVLWVAQETGDLPGGEAEDGAVRYEVVYEKGFETELSQGGYRVANEVARRGVEGEPIFWPGRQWHWRGDRFARGLDEVALNLVGGGPYGLVASSSRNGLDFDHNAIRGEFDLLDLTREATKVRYYSAWVDADDLEVYPTVVADTPPKKIESNPLTALAKKLTEPQGP